MMIFLRVGVLMLGDVGKLTMFHGCLQLNITHHFPPDGCQKTGPKAYLSIESCLVDKGILIINGL